MPKIQVQGSGADKRGPANYEWRLIGADEEKKAAIQDRNQRFPHSVVLWNKDEDKPAVGVLMEMNKEVRTITPITVAMGGGLGKLTGKLKTQLHSVAALELPPGSPPVEAIVMYNGVGYKREPTPPGKAYREYSLPPEISTDAKGNRNNDVRGTIDYFTSNDDNRLISRAAPPAPPLPEGHHGVTADGDTTLTLGQKGHFHIAANKAGGPSVIQIETASQTVNGQKVPAGFTGREVLGDQTTLRRGNDTSYTFDKSTEVQMVENGVPFYAIKNGVGTPIAGVAMGGAAPAPGRPGQPAPAKTATPAMPSPAGGSTTLNDQQVREMRMALSEITGKSLEKLLDKGVDVRNGHWVYLPETRKALEERQPKIADVQAGVEKDMERIALAWRNVKDKALNEKSVAAAPVVLETAGGKPDYKLNPNITPRDDVNATPKGGLWNELKTKVMPMLEKLKGKQASVDLEQEPQQQFAAVEQKPVTVAGWPPSPENALSTVTGKLGFDKLVADAIKGMNIPGAQQTERAGAGALPLVANTGKGKGEHTV